MVTSRTGVLALGLLLVRCGPSVPATPEPPARRPGSCQVPGRLDFGAVLVGDRQARTVVLANDGEETATARLGAVSAGAGFAARVPGWQVLTLAPGDSAALPLTFTPAREGPAQGTAQVSLGAHCPVVVVQLVGEGVTRPLRVTPQELDLGVVSLGRQGVGRARLSNRIARPVRLEGAVAGPALVEVEPQGPLEVPPAQLLGEAWVEGVLELQFRFTATSPGEQRGEWKAVVELISQPELRLALKGFGGGPEVGLAPDGVLDLGTVVLPAEGGRPASPASPLMLRNVGRDASPPDVRSALRLLEPRFTVLGTGGTLAEELCPAFLDPESGRCTPFLPGYDEELGLPVGTALALPFRARPATPGEKSWSVTIHTNAGLEPQKTLQVVARAVVLPACRAEVSSERLDFGALAPGTQRVLSVVVRNLGTRPGEDCILSHVRLAPGSHPGFALTPVREVRLPPGGSEELVVRLAVPTASAFRPLAGQLLFGLSDPLRPDRTVELSAQPGGGCLALSPGALDFGVVQQGCRSAEQPVVLANGCSWPVTLDEVSLCPAGAEATCDFEVRGVQAGQMLERGQAPVVAQVRFVPRVTGRAAATLGVRYRVGNSGSLGESAWLRGSSSLDGRNGESFRETPAPLIDVLWVLQGTSGLPSRFPELTTHLQAFLQPLTNAGLDWRLATTGANSWGGRFTGTTTGRTVLSAATPQLQSEFEALTSPWASGSGDVHRCLEPALRALTPPLSTSDNTGFRTEAGLAILCVSNEDEDSTWPVSYYVTRLQSLKDPLRAGAVQLHALAPRYDEGQRRCGIPSQAQGRYAEAVARARGTHLNICGVDWAQAMATLGQRVAGRRSTFHLKGTPDAARGLEVRTDGTLLPAEVGGERRWRYDVASNAVELDPLYLPDRGREVQVSYVAACL